MYYVYILANDSNSTLYIGITNNLLRRVSEHKLQIVDGFTKTYNVHKLVYYEEFNSPQFAIDREKQLKKWSRAKKNALIESVNSSWTEIELN